MFDHTTASGVLREEHVLILKVAHALEDHLADTPDGTPLDYDLVEKCTSFFRLFADACHHGKEEDLLFPAMVEGGMPSDEGPIAVMMYEHTVGRAFVARMTAAIPGARAGEQAANAELRAAANGFIEMIVPHIGKEDNVLFNIADGMVVGPECKDLCAQYDEVCARTFEGQSKDQLEALGNSILSS
jgi:hemerythrin-like domain-containing protein